MKKITFLLIISLASFLMVHAQKENGTVYSEHDGITKTRALWDAFVKGDKEAYLDFYADTVRHVENGIMKKVLKANLGAGVDWWKGVDHLAIKDDAPAFPDAIQYKEGGLWVQDWLKISGTHKKSGINIDWAVHDLYHFNDEGKIDIISQYYNPALFEEINNSSRTIENGTIYINHPYIVTVRKCVNAYCAEDVDALTSFYDPNANFWSSMFKVNNFISLKDKMEENKQTFANLDNIELQQVGYPDCIYYSKDDNYVVNSWWKLSYTTSDGKKKTDIPIMIIHDFNKEGKIVRELIFQSSNHFE